MSEKEAVLKLVEALLRKGTELDGNWGNPTFRGTLLEIKEGLTKNN